MNTSLDITGGNNVCDLINEWFKENKPWLRELDLCYDYRYCRGGSNKDTYRNHIEIIDNTVGLVIARIYASNQSIYSIQIVGSESHFMRSSRPARFGDDNSIYDPDFFNWLMKSIKILLRY